MSEQKSIRYFLGANSENGFYSLYDGFADCRGGDFLWVIKGGPGCGKSTFMKYIGRAAQEAGLAVEYILCSGDPSSLDGISIPELRCAYVDGTAPHIREAELPAAGSLYLDLGAFYRPEPLRGRREELAALLDSYRARYGRAYALLRAAGLVSPERVPGLPAPETEAAVRDRAAAMARRVLPEGGGFTEKRRFLSALTCEGHVTLWETAAGQCGRICTLDNELGAAPLFLDELEKQCRQRGLPAVACPDPLHPARLEALLLPQAGTAFLSVTRSRPYPGEVWRHVRLDAMAGADDVRRAREEMRRARRLQNALLEEALASLSAAKRLHDELEGIYNPHVDFAGLIELAELHVDCLLGRLE